MDISSSLPLVYYTLSGLLNFATSIILILIVLIKNPRPLTNKIFILFMSAVGFWSFFYFLWLNTNDSSLADFYLRTCMIGVIYMPAIFTHFIISIVRQNVPFLLNQRINNKYLVIGNYTLSALFVATIYTSWFAKEGGPYKIFPYWALPGPIFPLHIIHVFFNFIYSNNLMLRAIKQSKGIFRNQVLYLLIGIIISLPAGATNYFFWYRIPFPPILNISVSFGVPFVTYGILKFRLMDINIIFKKGTVYALGILLVLIPTYLISLWIEYIFFNTINITYSIIIFCLLTATAIAFYKVRVKAETAIEKVLFKNKYDYYKILTNFTKDLVSVLTLDELLNKIIATFTEALKIDKASVFLFDEQKKIYEIKASHGLDEEKDKVKIKENEPLISYFFKKGDVAIGEEIRRYPDSQENREIIKLLGALESEIAIPFIESGKIMGFCNLGAKGDGGMYSYEDIELFLSIGRQAAIAIQSARLVERIKESKHIIRRMERLKTIGDLAAGFAHEIRNPLVPIKTCLQLLPERYGKDADFTEKIPNYALKEVERIERLLKEIMDYSRPRTPVLKEEDINEVIDGTVQFIEYQAKKKGIKIERDYDETLPKIRVDREQMKQVLLNLIINAMDAVQLVRDSASSNEANGNGRIEINTSKVKHMFSSYGKIGEGDFVQIEVADNGIGIAKENLDRIFNPFYTTKHTSYDREGTGLGLSIVQEIVAEHHGFVEVKSDLGVGSSFYVNLPVKLVDINVRQERRKLYY